MDEHRTDSAMDASIAVARTVKARITRPDGSAVIGHMEVGGMLVPHLGAAPALQCPLLRTYSVPATAVAIMGSMHCCCCCCWGGGV